MLGKVVITTKFLICLSLVINLYALPASSNSETISSTAIETTGFFIEDSDGYCSTLTVEKPIQASMNTEIVEIPMEDKIFEGGLLEIIIQEIPLENSDGCANTLTVERLTQVPYVIEVRETPVEENSYGVGYNP